MSHNIEAALFSVSGGKFHKPAGPMFQGQAFRSTRAACGITVVPQNYYVKVDDANRATGGRLAAYMCQHCAKKETL